MYKNKNWVLQKWQLAFSRSMDPICLLSKQMTRESSVFFPTPIKLKAQCGKAVAVDIRTIFAYLSLHTRNVNSVENETAVMSQKFRQILFV